MKNIHVFFFFFFFFFFSCLFAVGMFQASNVCRYEERVLGTLPVGPECDGLIKAIDSDIKRCEGIKEVCRFGGCGGAAGDSCTIDYVDLYETFKKLDHVVDGSVLQCTIGTFILTTHRWSADRCTKARQNYDTCVRSELNIDACLAKAIIPGTDYIIPEIFSAPPPPAENYQWSIPEKRAVRREI
jgi:hypothetical protein